MSSNSLEKKIVQLGEKHDIQELQKLIKNTSIKVLTTILEAKFGRNDFTTFWNYLLLGFNSGQYESLEKRFACVKCFLDALMKIEFTYKQTYDLVTRLCQDLVTFPSEQLVEILEHCTNGMRAGDSKCVSWKDLLPETLNILANTPQLNVNGVTMKGPEYRDSTVRNLCTMRWPTEVLTPLADMFKDLHLNGHELSVVLNKFAGALQVMSPSELPALSYQLFSICSTASQIIVPLVALEKYFHRFYYKKLFADMLSNTTDFDSIDSYSDKELREAEETVLHHLNYCTQYKISEQQMCVVLRNFLSMPDVILTPFMLSAILSMTAANREPDSRLSSSMLLPLLRTVVKNNEDERSLADYSVWCRDSLQRKQVDLEQIFIVLIDQNKEGKDVITPGLVNLAFVLLKTKSSAALNALAIGFLAKFIRKRFVFGQGIVKKLAEWMIVEQDQLQYSECLTQLSVADTFTVSECIKTINYVMDFFLWIPGEQSMRMMSFILPVLKISSIVRDAFIEVLRKAMNSSDAKIRRTAIYGFCMILKQLNNSNSQRSQIGSAASGFCTQQSISGFSLMSQATLGNRSNPQRHFDMLTLEIIGLLRNCFNQTLDIKRTLYENLQRAVELNSKLVPHVLQFIDWHFRHYFDNYASDADDSEFCVKFDKIARSNDAQENEIEVNDNLGQLILFVSHCLVIFEKFESGCYDTREMEHLLSLSQQKVIAKELKYEPMSGNLTHLKNELIIQQLNFIEGLMAHSLLTSKNTNEHVKQLLPLFKEHRKLSDGFKYLAGGSKKKKSKSTNETVGSTSNITINGVAVKKINSNVENIWDLSVVEKLMRLLHEDIVPFAKPQDTTALRANCEFVHYVLEVAAIKVEAIRREPAYKQLSHSRRTLKYLTDITKVVYERCIRRLPELWRDFDMKTASLAAECFQQCLQTANEVYKKKFANDFVKDFDYAPKSNCKSAPSMLHDIIDEFMQEHPADSTADDDTDASSKRKIPQALLQCLAVLYDNISYENRLTIESYTWLLQFCKNNEVHTKELGLVHRLLFEQRQKTHSGAFFQTIALHLGQVLSAINDEAFEKQLTEAPLSFQLKSITKESAESCLHYLYSALRKQIEDVEYFTIKANNLNYKYRIVLEDDREMLMASLRSLERSICSQLVHISNTLLSLTNVCIPLGMCMDSLLKLLMQQYICLKNLAKHFLNCCATMQVTIQGTKFDLLLRVVGKPLSSNIYALITYIEANIFEEGSTKKSNPQAEKAKILRETKLIPKIILCVENFNKHVILLSKKTTDRLANFLHYGVVRDFRIKTSELKAAIERTLSHSDRIENDPSELNDSEQRTEEETLLERMEAEAEDGETDYDGGPGDDDDDDDTASSVSSRSSKTTKSKTKPKPKSKSNSQSKSSTAKRPINLDDEHDSESLPTPEDVSILENESNQDSASQVLKNLAKINKNVKKRTLHQSENSDVGVSAPAAKKRRGRQSKK